MNQSEAEKKIEEIHEVFYSGHRLIGSPQGLVLSGAALLLVAGVAWITRLWQTGRIGAGAYGTGALTLFAVLFLLSFRAKRVRQDQKQATDASGGKIHPLIKQTFGTANALFFAGFGLTAAWWLHTDRLISVWMVLLGIVANLWGRFIHKRVEAFSYVLMAGAIVLAGLSEFQIWSDKLVPAALTFLGAWTIGLGLIIQNCQRR